MQAARAARQPVLHRAGQHADVSPNLGTPAAAGGLAPYGTEQPASWTWAGSSTRRAIHHSWEEAAGTWSSRTTSPTSRPDPYRGPVAVRARPVLRPDPLPLTRALVQLAPAASAGGTPGDPVTLPLLRRQSRRRWPRPWRTLRRLLRHGDANDAGAQLLLRRSATRRSTRHRDGVPVPRPTSLNSPLGSRQHTNAGRPRPANDPFRAGDAAAHRYRRAVPRAARPIRPRLSTTSYRLNFPGARNGYRRPSVTGSACAGPPTRSPRSRRPTP